MKYRFIPEDLFLGEGCTFPIVRNSVFFFPLSTATHRNTQSDDTARYFVDVNLFIDVLPRLLCLPRAITKH